MDNITNLLNRISKYKKILESKDLTDIEKKVYKNIIKLLLEEIPVKVVICGDKVLTNNFNHYQNKRR